MRNRSAIISLLISAMAIVACLFPGLALAGERQDTGPIAASANGQMVQSGLQVQNVSASATNAINNLKTRQYYKLGNNCPRGLNVGWLKYNPGSTYCENECYAFAAGVCNELFGSNPGGIMDTGYTCSRLNGFSCVEAYKWPSFETVKAMMQKGYPGDFIQFCSGNEWGGAQHSAILEAVDANGVRIYQHGNSGHIMSTYYNWNDFYEKYLGMKTKNYRGYNGLGLYHADNYKERYPDSVPDPVYPTPMTIAEGLYTIRAAANTSYALDVAYGSMDNQANVQLYTFHDADNQQFRFVRNSDDGSYTILNVRSGKAVDVQWNGKTDGTSIQQYEPNYSEAQRWFIEDAGGGFVRMRSKASNKYLDIENATMSNGTKIEIWTGHTGWAQKFKLVPCSIDVPESVYSIRSMKNLSYGLDVYGGSSVEQANNVQLFLFHTGDNQLFELKRNSDDSSYTILNVESGKALAVKRNKEDGIVNVIQYTLDYAEEQRWYIEDGGGGSVKIRNKAVGMYLDVANGVMANGTNVLVWSGNAGENQKFKLLTNGSFGTKTDSLPDGYYSIISSCDESYAVDNEGGVVRNDNNIRVEPRDGGDSQVFHFYKDQYGSYTISPKQDDSYVVEVSGPGLDDGANVALYENHHSRKQMWVLRDCGDGLYAFQNLYTGKFLDLRGGVASAGANISQWVGNGSPAQKFRLVEWVDMSAVNQERADEAVAAINAIGSVSLASGDAIERAREAYDALTDDQKALVPQDALDALVAAESAYAQAVADREAQNRAAADSVVEAIAAIGDVTLDSAGAIAEARAAYDALTDDQRALVPDEAVDALAAAEGAYARALQEAQDEEARADKAASDAVVARIDAIGAVTLDSENAIESARAAYDALTDDQRALVPAAKLSILEQAEADYANLAAARQAAEEKAAADASAANDAVAKVEAIGEVTLESGSAIETARSAYDALTDDQKALVPAGILNKLVTAEQAYARAVSNAEREAAEREADQEVADRVVALIDSIGNVTLDSKEAIDAAAEAFEALSFSQKDMVPPEAVNSLANAISAYDRALADKEAADKGAAFDVVAAIASIGLVHEGSKDAIAEAGSLYDALTDDQKALVPSNMLDALASAENEYAAIEKTKEEAEQMEIADKAAAADAVAAIDSIGTVTSGSEDAIKVARRAYDSLTASQKVFVPATALETLLGAEAAYNKLLDDKGAVGKASGEKKSRGSIAIKAKKKSFRVKAGKSLKASKLYKVTRNLSGGAVTYELVKVPAKAKKYIAVASSGKIKVKKGIKRGKTYKIKIRATSASTSRYMAATSKPITIKIKVR